MELFHCEAEPNAVISSYNGPCFAAARPKDTEVCKKVLAAWAMGATPFLYPRVSNDSPTQPRKCPQLASIRIALY